MPSLSATASTGTPLSSENVELLEYIGILVPVRTQVDVDEFIIRSQDRRQIGPLKRQIEDVAVETPVRAEDQQQTLVLAGSLPFGIFDLDVRVNVGGINILLHVGRLLQAGRGESVRSTPTKRHCSACFTQY